MPREKKEKWAACGGHGAKVGWGACTLTRPILGLSPLAGSSFLQQEARVLLQNNRHPLFRPVVVHLQFNLAPDCDTLTWWLGALSREGIKRYIYESRAVMVVVMRECFAMSEKGAAILSCGMEVC